MNCYPVAPPAECPRFFYSIVTDSEIDIKHLQVECLCLFDAKSIQSLDELPKNESFHLILVAHGRTYNTR